MVYHTMLYVSITIKLNNLICIYITYFKHNINITMNNKTDIKTPTL